MESSYIFTSFFMLLAMIATVMTASLPQNKLDDALTQKERVFLESHKLHAGGIRFKADRDSKILRPTTPPAQTDESQILNVVSGTNGKKKGQQRKRPVQKKPSESKIIFIRLPPSPYTMVPGLGYVSKPERINPFDVIAPVAIQPTNTHQIRKKHPLPDSKIIRVPGTFSFNGKPSSRVFTLSQRKRHSRKPSLKRRISNF